MMQRLKIYVLFSLMLIVLAAKGQIRDIENFADSSDFRFQEIDNSIQDDESIIFCGKIQPNWGSIAKPFIASIDTSGEFNWSTINHFADSSYYFIWHDLFKGEDGYIYALSEDFSSNSPTDYTLWKVDPSDGSIVLQNGILGRNLGDFAIADFDASHLVATYSNPFNENIMAVISKSTLDTLSTEQFPSINSVNTEIAVDHSKNVIAVHGDKLIKYNGRNFDQILWEQSLLSGNTALATVTHLHIDELNQLYVMGYTASGSRDVVVEKIDMVRGDVVWEVLATQALSSFYVNDFVDQNGSLYISVYEGRFGSSSSAYVYTKINKQTGVLDYGSGFVPTGHSNVLDSYSNSIAVDCNGDVYLSGTHKVDLGGGLSRTYWGLIKANGTNGSKILQRGYGANNFANSNRVRSQGRICYAYGDKIISIGNLSNQNYTTAGFLKFDGANNATISVKEISNGFHIGAKVLAMEEKNDSLYVLRKEGRDASLALYDANGQLVYNSYLNRRYHVLDGELTINGDEVVVALHQLDIKNNYPFYDYSSATIGVYYLNRNTGARTSTNIYTNRINDAKIESIEIGARRTYVFYTENNRTYFLLHNPQTGAFFRQNLGSMLQANFDLNVDKVYDRGGELLAFMQDRIAVIDKSKGTYTTFGINLVSGQDFRFNDLAVIQDTLYAAGMLISSNRPAILAIDKSKDSLMWQNVFSTSGEFSKIDTLNGNLIVSGVKDSTTKALYLSKDSAQIIWETALDSIGHLNGFVFDMSINRLSRKICIAGIKNNTMNTSDGFISLLEYSGAIKNNFDVSSNGNLNSFVNEIVVHQDSAFWLGGAQNVYAKQIGFIKSIYTTPAIITSLSSNTKEKSIKPYIFPNPSRNYINVRNIVSKEAYFDIYDISGKHIIKNQSISNKSTIRLDGFVKGSYILIIRQDYRVDQFKFFKL